MSVVVYRSLLTRRLTTWLGTHESYEPGFASSARSIVSG